MAVPITVAMQNQIAQNYIAILGRNPDPSGFSFWVQTYADANGTAAALTSITNGFGNSAEFKATYAGDTTQVAVDKLYQNVLLRAADAGGLAYWTNYANGLISSGQTISNAYAQTGAQMIYNASSQGLSDAAGINARTATAVATGIAEPVTSYNLSTTSPETITALGVNNVINGTQLTLNANDTIIGSTNGKTKLSIVDTGTAAWTPTAASITNVQTVAIRNINGVAPVTGVAAVNEQQTVTVGGVVASAAASEKISFLGVETASLASAVVASGIATAIVAAKANIIAGAQGVALGLIDISANQAVLTLTFAAAKGNIADIAAGPNSNGATFSVGTQTVAGNVGVQAVTAASFTDTIAAGTFGGATSFENDISTGQVNFTGLTAAQSVKIIGNGSSTNGVTDATWGGTVTAPVLNVAGGVKNGNVVIAAAGATSLTINSTGAANTIGTLGAPASATALNINATTNLTTGAITATAVTTITVSGAATLVTLGTLPAAVTTINGAGLTAGGIAATLTSTVTAFTGGAGVDTVTTVSTTSGTSKIDGGAGAGDILNVADTTSISTLALGGRFTNFEILRNTAGGASAPVSNVAGITAIQLGATGQGATGMTAAQALNVTNRADNATQTLALTTATGTSDVLTVTLLNSTSAATSADLTATTVDGFETMNVISSSGGVGDINALGFAAGAQLKTLNLSGAFPISVTTTNITTAGGTAINASGVTYAGSSGTKAFTITGNLLKGSSVRGSDSLDTITVTAAAAGVATEFVTYDAGAGNDLINATVAAINNNGGATASVKIDGGANTDTLNFTENGLTLVNANFQFLTNIETITYTVANQAISITGGAWFNTNFGGNTTTTLTLGDATNAQVNAVDLTGFTGNATVSLTATAATTQAQAITTGSGADVITALVAGLTSGSLTVVAGAGNDTINVTSSATAITTGAIALTGGTGADTFVISAGPTATDQDKVTFTVAAGDSLITSNDVIRGFALADGTTKSYILDLAGTAVAQTAVANQSVTGYTAAELQYTITGGLLTFAGTSAAGLTAATKASIAQTVVTDAAGTVAFTQAVGDGTTDSYVFANNSTADSLVQLVGVTALGLGGGAMVTTGFITVA